MRERVFGGAAAGGLGLGFFCACTYFFCAFLKNQQNKLYFSVGVYFFGVCIVTHRKISLWVLVFFCRDILEPTEKS